MMPAETNKNTAGNIPQNLALSSQALKDITTNLNNTLWLGGVTGVLGIVGYALNLQKTGWKILFLFILISSASYISGFFLGFLFGIPKRNTDKESAYNLSTNLVDISDWLTKIIIGLGLIEIKRIPADLISIGEYIQKATGGEDSMKIFSVCCIVYFSIFGLYYGYNYMRLFLSGQFKEADDNLLQKQIMLTETAQVLNKQDLSPDNLDPSALIKVKEYNQLLKSTKTEADYTFDDWYFKGISAYDNKDYNNTIAYMNNALEKDPASRNAPDAYLYSGLASGFLKQYDKSLSANNTIIANYKDYTYLYLAHHNNGVTYDDLLQYDKALNEFEAATNIKPDYSDSWVGKGYALLNLNRAKDALAPLDMAIKINPSDPNPWYNLACAYAALNNKDELLKNLKKAIELKPEFRQSARTSRWLENFRNDDDFKQLLE